MNILYGFTHIRESLIYLLSKCRFINDKMYISIKYYLIFKKKIDLENPKTINEKIQWLKLYDRNPKYVSLVDKIEVRRYVSQKIGEKYLVPILGIWNNVNEIDIDSLPKQFVLKCSHDSGSIVICKEKSKFNVNEAKCKLNKKIKRNLYWWNREWVYKNLKPRVIAEKYLEDKVTGELRDYKFFCFNGKCKGLFIATNRQNNSIPLSFDFFDINFNHLDVRQGHPNADVIPNPPINIKEMITLAEKLSDDIPFVRIDFYEVEGKTYFGEMTFFHDGGFVQFDPNYWDERFGTLLQLPSNNN